MTIAGSAIVNNDTSIAVFRRNVNACLRKQVAGGQLYFNSPAIQVSLNNPTGVAYALNGTVYLIDGSKVDQLNPRRD